MLTVLGVASYMMNPFGVLSLCGIILLILCIIATCPKEDLNKEMSGACFMVIVIVLVGGLTLLSDGGGKSQSTMIKGQEVTKEEIKIVDDYMDSKRKDLGGVSKEKQKLIVDSMTEYEHGGQFRSSKVGFYYDYKSTSSWAPRWLYHPSIWLWCPIISLLFSRPFWMAIFLQSLTK
jgi:hypothetical protein